MLVVIYDDMISSLPLHDDLGLLKERETHAAVNGFRACECGNDERTQ